MRCSKGEPYLIFQNLRGIGEMLKYMAQAKAKMQKGIFELNEGFPTMQKEKPKGLMIRCKRVMMLSWPPIHEVVQ